MKRTYEIEKVIGVRKKAKRCRARDSLEQMNLHSRHGKDWGPLYSKSNKNCALIYAKRHGNRRTLSNKFGREFRYGQIPMGKSRSSEE